MSRQESRLEICLDSPKHKKLILEAANQHSLKPNLSQFLRPWIREVSKMVEAGISSETFARKRKDIHALIKNTE